MAEVPFQYKGAKAPGQYTRRLPAKQDQDLRIYIKAKEIICELQNFALGLNNVRMTKDQVRAASILLHKVLPDMAPVDTNGTGVSPVKIEIVRFGGDRRIETQPTIIDATPVPEGEKVN